MYAITHPWPNLSETMFEKRVHCLQFYFRAALTQSLITWYPDPLTFVHGPLTRYVKLRVAHSPGMPGTLPRHRRLPIPTCIMARAVTHVRWCIPGSLTHGFLWRRWRGKLSRHSRRMRNPQFYVSCKRPILRRQANRQNYIPISHTCTSIRVVGSSLGSPTRFRIRCQKGQKF